MATTVQVGVQEFIDAHQALRTQLNREASYHMARARIARENIQTLRSSWTAQFHKKEIAQLEAEIEMHDRLVQENLAACARASKAATPILPVLKNL